MLDRLIYREPKVARVASFDVREQAWRMSRPYIDKDEPVDIKQLSKMDLSLNSLKFAVLHLKTSAAFRELLTSFRPFSMWAQTSRVNRIEDIELGSYVENLPFGSELVMKMDIVRSRYDLHQDVRRMKLPLAYLTEYFYGTDLATWIIILKTIREYYPDLYKIYCTDLFYLIKDLDNLDQYPQKPLVLPTKKDIDELPDKFESSLITIIKANITLAQRAQLVRHVSISVYDDLWSTPFEELYLSTLESTVNAAIYGPTSSVRRMISKRICWTAQFELWEGITLSYVDNYETFVETLPCKGYGGTCPFKMDQEGRVQGREPGIPCPIYTRDAGYIDIRQKEIGDSSILSYFKQLRY